MKQIGWIILKEIRQNLRDRSGMFMMTLFPIVLILVLGLSLSNMFTLSGPPATVEALYLADDSATAVAFREEFAPEAAKNGLILTEVTDKTEALSKVERNTVSTLIEIRRDSISLHQNADSQYAASLVSFMVHGFAQRVDAVRAVYRWDPAAMRFATTETGSGNSFTEAIPVNAARTPRSIDYYAITMLTMIIMYGSMVGLNAISAEKDRRTLSRLLATPATNMQILVGKLCGAFLTVVVQSLLVFGFSALVLRTEWGTDFPAVFAIILSQIFMMTAAGIGAGYLFKSGASGAALFQGVIPLFVFLGGGYVNLDDIGVGGVMKTLMEISPVRWINRAIIEIIWMGRYDRFLPTIALCLTVGIVFLVTSAVFSRREVQNA